MDGNSDFIEETMELSDDGRNLRRQIAGIHGEQARQVAINQQASAIELECMVERYRGLREGPRRRPVEIVEGFDWLSSDQDVIATAKPPKRLLNFSSMIV